MSEEQKEGKFKVIKVTELDDLAFLNKEIPESDLTIQTDKQLIQFKYEKEDSENKKLTVIKPGIYSLEEGNAGIYLDKMELRKYKLLECIDNTNTILSEANKFFSRISVYKELKRDPKRALLLASPPGVGKTSAINKVCEKILEEDEGTCVVVWDTSSIRSSSVNKFFLNNSKFDKKTTKLIMVMEDIGGGSVEDSYGARGADSSLLNLLDGIGTPFKGVPTFIIATTNNPEQSVAALIDRPGRFDKVVIMDTPNEKECTDLLAFIAERELSEEDVKAAALAAKNKFSIAHLQEVVIRSRLDDISLLESTEQLVNHKKNFKNAFQKVNGFGLGINS